MLVSRKAINFIQISGLKEMLMHANEEIWNEESGRTIWETSYRCCVMKKVIHKKAAAGGRYDFSGL